MARILVVDDDPLVREVIILALREAGNDVSEASDGRRALDMLERQVFDAVVTDILMPEIDGIGLVLTIRKRHLGTRILCVSGGDRFGYTDYLRMAIDLGADLILPKPFTPKQLVAAVQEVLSMPPTPPSGSGLGP